MPKVPKLYGVDISAYQSTSLYHERINGAKFVFIKATEGTGYFNPKATAQVRSAHANHMYVNAYHFATFGCNASRARVEAKHFIHYAKYLNIAKSRYLALDWEAGDGNYIYGGKYLSAKAILAFMGVIKRAGYKPLLYSSASCLRSNIDTHKVLKKYPNCLWVASYPSSGIANFDAFPSMNGVAMWQFTDNWCGLKVDGNISLIELFKDGTKKPVEKPKPKPVKKTSIVYAPVINHNPNWQIRLLDSDGHYTKYIRTNTRWKYFDVKMIRGMKCYKLGTDQQWVPAKFTQIIR